MIIAIHLTLYIALGLTSGYYTQGYLTVYILLGLTSGNQALHGRDILTEYGKMKRNLLGDVTHIQQRAVFFDHLRQLDEFDKKVTLSVESCQM